MIVRIMGHGQWVMEPEVMIGLNDLDDAVEAAVERGDQAGLQAALEKLNASVQAHGTPVPDEVLAESDLVLPDTDATVEEVRALLESTSEYYGLIPDAETFESEFDVQDGSGQVSEVAADLGDAPPGDAEATPEVARTIQSLEDVPPSGSGGHQL